MKWAKRRKIFVVCVVAIALWWLDREEVIPADYLPVQPVVIEGLKVDPCLRTSPENNSRHLSPFLHLRIVAHGPYDFFMSVRDFGKRFSRARLLGVTLSTPSGDWTEQLVIPDTPSDWETIAPQCWTDEFNEALFVATAREDVPTNSWSNIVVPEVKRIFADVSFQLERDGDTKAFTERFELRRNDKKFYVSFIVQTIYEY